MPRTDITLGDNDVVVDTTYLKIAGPEGVALELDGQVARQRADGPAAGDRRRALVHASGDALLVNYAGDFTGGVNINGGAAMVAVESTGEVRLDSHEGATRISGGSLDVKAPNIDLHSGRVVIHGPKLILSYHEDTRVENPRSSLTGSGPFGRPVVPIVRIDVELDVLQEILSLKKRLDQAEAALAALRG